MSEPSLIAVPESACFASVILTMENVNGVTQSPFNLKEQVYKWDGQRWRMSLTMPPLTSRAVASDWVSFGMKLRGIYNVFLMGDPSSKNPRGIANGTPVVLGNNQTGGSLKISTGVNNVTNYLMSGDYIQVGTGLNSRLHMVVENANTDLNGEALLQLVPDLRYSPADGSAVVVRDAKGVFRMTDNNFSWSVQPSRVVRLSFDAIEVL